MSTLENQPPSDPPAAASAPPAAALTAGPPRRRAARVLSVVSLSVAIAAVGVVIGTYAKPAPPAPMEEATAEAWEATGALSDALRALRPGASRNPARKLTKRAAGAVDTAGKRVAALKVSVADTPLRARVLSTLRSDAAWIDAVGSTLANPRSPRRADLSRLAKRAANDTALIAEEIEEASNSVGGTGRLLSATKPA